MLLECLSFDAQQEKWEASLRVTFDSLRIKEYPAKPSKTKDTRLKAIAAGAPHPVFTGNHG